MAGFSQLERVLWFLNLGLLPVLAFHLWKQGLHRTYRFFWLLLLLDLIEGVVLLPIPSNSTAYGITYVVFESLKLVLFFLVSLELCSNTLARYPGIATVGRLFIQVAGVLAIGIAGGIAAAMGDTGGPYPVLTMFFTLVRSVMITLAVLLMLNTLFLAWFPVRLSRNVARFLAGYVVYFSARALVMAGLTMLDPAFTRSLSAAAMIALAACMIFWLFTLRASGETAESVSGITWEPGLDARLVAQLDNLNSSLARAVRK
ncbi:MAG: hypothetical protein K2X35_22905 [Bryobacteraceae bacterium]|nr:hypothetical protein [Bryobacteraceae bacterium]